MLRSLPWILLIVLICTVLMNWTVAIRTEGPSGKEIPETESPAKSPGVVHGRERHFATPRQLADSNGMVEMALRDIRVQLHTGAWQTWDELSNQRPVVLVFLKKDCPCNEEFQPFFQRLENLYHGQVRFFGVLDGDIDAAARFARDNRVPYPIVADPGQQLIRTLKAENGGYNALLNSKGVITAFFPTCSADSLTALGGHIARLVGLPEKHLDVTGMPGALTTGCPFERER
ncbi:MAG: peroxiredoxin family protein [Gemmataceae bacterium]